MPKFNDLFGTLGNSFRVSLFGVRLKNAAGNLAVRNNADSADAELTTSKVNISGDVIALNSDAAGSGSDRTYTVQRGGTITQNTILILPSAGTAGQAMAIKAGSPAGTLELEAVSLSGTSDKVSKDTTSIAFGSTSPIALFTLPENATMTAMRVIVDIAFNGTPSLSIGITGTASKYLASTQVDLLTIATYEVYPDNLPGIAEALIATYSAGSATVGAGRIEVEYAIPV